MLLLSKSISQLLLPPGGLIMLAVIGLWFSHKRWGKSLIILSLSLLWLLSIEPTRDMLASPLEMFHKPLSLESLSNAPNMKHAAIVLLGGGIAEHSLEYEGRDELGRYAMMRSIYAAKIAQQTHLPIFATGGVPLTQRSESEASIMKRWLMWFGIAKEKIFVEAEANTTWENAALTKQLLSEKNIDSIILVTSANHMRRSVWCFEQQGLVVIPAPTDYLTEQESYDLRSFLPRWNVFNDSSQLLHEYMGLMWYKLKYNAHI